MTKTKQEIQELIERGASIDASERLLNKELKELFVGKTVTINKNWNGLRFGKSARNLKGESRVIDSVCYSDFHKDICFFLRKPNVDDIYNAPIYYSEIIIHGEG